LNDLLPTVVNIFFISFRTHYRVMSLRKSAGYFPYMFFQYPNIALMSPDRTQY